MRLDGVEYEPDPPSKHILRLLRADDPDGLWLAQNIKEMEASGFLKGRCLEASPDRDKDLWLLSGARHHLIYVFLRRHRKIGYLTVFSDDIDGRLSEAKLRLQQLTY